MELKVNIDLEAVVAQAVAPEKLQPILDKHITDAIASAIKDATGYRSKFREAVEAQLTEAMPHGLKIDDVAKERPFSPTSINLTAVAVGCTWTRAINPARATGSTAASTARSINSRSRETAASTP